MKNFSLCTSSSPLLLSLSSLLLPPCLPSNSSFSSLPASPSTFHFEPNAKEKTLNKIQQQQTSKVILNPSTPTTTLSTTKTSPKTTTTTITTAPVRAATKILFILAVNVKFILHLFVLSTSVFVVVRYNRVFLQLNVNNTLTSKIFK